MSNLGAGSPHLVALSGTGSAFKVAGPTRPVLQPAAPVKSQSGPTVKHATPQ